MSEKPPLSDEQVYDALHSAWLSLAAEKGATPQGDDVLKLARASLARCEVVLLTLEESAKGRTPSASFPHCD